VNREELTEAIDLAEKTLVEYGPDTDISQLLRKAEEKREPAGEEKAARTAGGDPAGANDGRCREFRGSDNDLQREVETRLFTETDSRLAEVRREIDEKQAAHASAMPSSVSDAVTPPSRGATWTNPSDDPGKDYVYQRSATTRDVPVAPSSDAAASAIFSALA